ncbi:serine hydrolase [Streptomyces sp. NRRL S-448]|uniref:serine hydrolase n=1 Tax=Streptomyces sp. NRRL S-448 TaxID=1463907 RepID=UPI000AE9F399
MRSSPRRDRPDSAAVGTVERGKSDPPNVRDHFRIASNTKTMTAALIMLLAQDGSCG